MKRKIKKVLCGIACVAIALLAYGGFMAWKDYRKDPDFCATIASYDRTHQLNVVSSIGYSLYLGMFTDVLDRRERARRDLLDGTIARRVTEQWGKREAQYCAFTNQLAKESNKKVESVGGLPSSPVKLFPEPTKVLTGMFGCLFNDVVSEAEIGCVCTEDIDSDEKLPLIRYELKEKNVYVYATEKDRRIYQIVRTIETKNANADEYVKMLADQYGVDCCKPLASRPGGVLMFSNATIHVSAELAYSPNVGFHQTGNVVVTARDRALRRVALEEARAKKREQMKKDLQ